MSDIVERLRSGAAHRTLVTTGLVNQAADEIEKLRAALERLVIGCEEDFKGGRKLRKRDVDKARAALGGPND